MSRYIDKDALKPDHYEEYEAEDDEYVYRYYSEEQIDQAPSIDIVRCKECKHREEYPCKVYHDDDWYCADGEREGE